MNIDEKLQLLGGSTTEPADLDAATGGQAQSSPPRVGVGFTRGRSKILSEAEGPGLSGAEGPKFPGLFDAKLPGGGTIRLARVLQTNACSRTCLYCATRCGRKFKRATFKPDELASTFMTMYNRRQCEGFFLTSGIPGDAPKVMDRLLATAEVLRHTFEYKGYLHLKILPGCEPSQIERACELATRVSLNLEAPTESALANIAPEKKLAVESLPQLEYARDVIRQLPDNRGARAGITTQFVVGAGGERDRDLLSMLKRLYDNKTLHHAHFSPFVPVVDTPLEGEQPVPSLRGGRLYQVDHLVRTYRFGMDEIALDADGNLPLAPDPKLAWALGHPERFPVELTTATYHEVLRVPGIGPKAATRLMANRKRFILRDADDLRALGMVSARAQAFVTWKGKRLCDPKMTKNIWPHGLPIDWSNVTTEELEQLRTSVSKKGKRFLHPDLSPRVTQLSLFSPVAVNRFAVNVECSPAAFR